ncbi:hypothetical protein DJ021_01505 [Phenylobacterium hankyongense]|uniref:PepSY domain-containing protein n=1 Tax=Phenylobacterium hankyongense TaxID=1813876 RepID=A0A328AWE5_9CAUL|nr:hypothetical protein DJ021_01505 [Phenylobacterium hankyongense]
MSLALLAGCSKPASQTAAAADSAGASASNAATGAADSAASGAAGAGGAVSPPSSSENSAINTDANKTETTQTPGSNSFTEAQAKGHIENAGYTDVTGLTKTADGMWTGQAKKGGKTMGVSLDFKGAVTAK